MEKNQRDGRTVTIFFITNCHNFFYNDLKILRRCAMIFGTFNTRLLRKAGYIDEPGESK